jgi:hypothetical protein
MDIRSSFDYPAIGRRQRVKELAFKLDLLNAVSISILVLKTG